MASLVFRTEYTSKALLRYFVVADISGISKPEHLKD